MELCPAPDPVCDVKCPHHNSAVNCYRHCKYAPVILSSEGKDYPIETLISPLVFEIKKLGVFHPCWSCEGHNDTLGNLWKIPRIWFYSDSVVHVRVLANAICELFIQKYISTPWNVVLSYSDITNSDTTFSLEPKTDDSETNLDALQSYIEIISENLETFFLKECSRLM